MQHACLTRRTTIGLLLGSAVARGARGGRSRAAECFLRSDTRAVPRGQSRIHRRLAEQDRAARHHQPVAWRLRCAGPRGDGRTGGRCRDAGARRRYRRACQTRPARRRLAEAAARQFRRPTPARWCSWCARAIPRRSATGPTCSSPGSAVITPNPKTSGGARWNFLAALGWAQRQPNATAETADTFMRALFHQVPVLDTGARGATTSFAQRGLGDVLLAWENEAWLARKEFGADKFEIVYPTLSILAEPPVAVVDRVVDKKGTRAMAQAYLEFLYTKQGQEIAARNFYRPRDAAVAARYAEQLSGAAYAHHSGLRRLGRRAGGLLRRWRHVRSRVHAGTMILAVRRSALPGFAPTLGVTLAVAVAHRAGAAGVAGAAAVGTWHRRRMAFDHRTARARRAAPELWRGDHRGGGERATRPADRLGDGALPLSRPQALPTR